MNGKNFFVTIISGIIIGLAVPTAQKYIIPDTRFEYQIEGPLKIGSTQAAKIIIKNKGIKSEKIYALSLILLIFGIKRVL